MNFVVLGHVGSDAGYWVFRDGKWVHVPGWQPEILREVTSALRIIAETQQFKTPGLAQTVTKGLTEFVQKQFDTRGMEGAVVILPSAQR